MVYSRLIEGCGPYLYKSVRKEQKVLSIYLGPGGKKKAKLYTTPPSRGPLDQYKTKEETVNPFATNAQIQVKPEKPKLHIEHKTREETRLTHLERMHLYAFAQKNGIDRAEIDHKISYEENKEYLETLAQNKGMTKDEIGLTQEQSAKWAGAYQDYKQSLKEDPEIEQKWKDYFTE